MVGFGIDIYIYPVEDDAIIRVDEILTTPNMVSCTAGQWTKVATNTVWVKLWKHVSVGRIVHTYRETGAAAPSDLTDAEPFGDVFLEINHSMALIFMF